MSPVFDHKMIFMIDHIVWNACLSDTESKEKAIATKNTQQTHTNDSDSVKTAKRSGQDGLEGDITQSYLWLAIDCSSDSVSD